MTDSQAAEYRKIVESYKTDPRWQALDAYLASDEANNHDDPDDNSWSMAYQQQAAIERSCRKSAESCRISGYL